MRSPPPRAEHAVESPFANGKGHWTMRPCKHQITAHPNAMRKNITPIPGAKDEISWDVRCVRCFVKKVMPQQPEWLVNSRGRLSSGAVWVSMVCTCGLLMGELKGLQLQVACKT
eukprot:6388475-Amphidinium_carterae.1